MSFSRLHSKCESPTGYWFRISSPVVKSPDFEVRKMWVRILALLLSNLLEIISWFLLSLFQFCCQPAPVSFSSLLPHWISFCPGHLQVSCCRSWPSLSVTVGQHLIKQITASPSLSTLLSWLPGTISSWFPSLTVLHHHIDWVISQGSLH